MPKRGHSAENRIPVFHSPEYQENPLSSRDFLQLGVGSNPLHEWQPFALHVFEVEVPELPGVLLPLPPLLAHFRGVPGFSGIRNSIQSFVSFVSFIPFLRSYTNSPTRLYRLFIIRDFYSDRSVSRGSVKYDLPFDVNMTPVWIINPIACAFKVHSNKKSQLRSAV